MRFAVCVFSLGFPLFGQLQFLNPNADWSANSPPLVADGSGNTYVVSNTTGTAGITITKRDAANRAVYTFSFAADLWAVPQAAAVDSRGNLWVGGWTNSYQFPLVKPLLHALVPDSDSRLPRQGFLVKVDAAGTRLLFSTLVGGNDPTVPFTAHNFGFPSAVNALAVDAGDNVMLAGVTTSPTFPVSANAFQKKGGGLSDPTQTDTSDVRTSSFVMKISSEGDALLYSTYLGGSTRVCTVQGGCSTAIVSALAVDDVGRPTVAGTTLQTDFPVTPGAYQADCHTSLFHACVFVTRFTADGGGLEWSTFLDDAAYGLRVSGLVLDDQNNAVVAGVTASSIFPATPDALQPRQPAASGAASGFVAVVRNDGGSVPHATYFGGNSGAALGGLSRDAKGNYWITGESTSGDLPKAGGSVVLGKDYVAELDASLSHVLRYYGLPHGAAGRGMAGLRSGGVLVSGVSNAVNTLPATLAATPSVWGVAGVVETSVAPHIAPGEVVSLYGVNLGPDPGASAKLDATGKVSTELSGTRVVVNGIPAPILYAGVNQINVVIPFEAPSGQQASIQVTTAAGSTTINTFQVDTARPQIVSVLLNADGTVNGPDHPAPRGSVVTMWSTGGGAMDSGMVDGLVSEPPLGKLTGHVGVALSRLSPPQSGELTFAGAAPGMVAGVQQINFRVPAVESGYGTCHVSCPVVLWIDGQRSPGPEPMLSVVE